MELLGLRHHCGMRLGKLVGGRLLLMCLLGQGCLLLFRCQLLLPGGCLLLLELCLLFGLFGNGPGDLLLLCLVMGLHLLVCNTAGCGLLLGSCLLLC